ncbi:MAG: translation initiation factor IF-3 C-terminal domain-containing protein, partial [Clostridia bacterium]|nr:translation initiation factor IF-3 C-terminal domain-containing protein [Clostridia bacterium]
REISHADLGHRLCQRLVQQLADLATIEKAPVVEGRNLVMVLAPRQDAAKG